MEAHDFSVTCGTTGPAEVVTVAGEIDLYTYEPVQEAIESCMAGKTAPVILDFTDVAFIDSTCLAMLLRTRRRLIAEGRNFFLVTQTPLLVRTLAMTATEPLLGLKDTVEEALADLAPAPDGSSRPGSVSP